MGDRCYSHIVCLARDQKRFAELGYQPDSDEGQTPGIIEMFDEQANYGNIDALMQLEDIPFYGQNGAASGYGPSVFVNDGEKRFLEVEATWDNAAPMLELHENGTIVGQDLAREYWEVLKRTQIRMRQLAANWIAQGHTAPAPAKKVRLELPVLLYVDLKIEATATLTEIKAKLWEWLGHPGEERGLTIPAHAGLGFSHARIYPSDVDACDSARDLAVVDKG